ncbi:S-layer glycoprotein N-glycosyltransferase AglJ [Methanolapillus millepedarum]|uniref:Glycosyltransferase 2-like domain-containing protein n=1 Tax=Methanolapillus millepedarum TaxID=3028296 RepID=A0AA96VEY4_9EURY|nr:hypothetical protein MsAc7_09170 [Methanosarcinaceae archaeon Ac7]
MSSENNDEKNNLIFDKNDVCIFIPVLNEEYAIKGVIEDFKKEGFYNILVVDGNSKDKTREVAEEAGARVVIQSGKGKGQAMIQAFSMIHSKYIVMIDGDGTELASEIYRLLNPVLEGKADHVAGDRIAGRTEKAFTPVNLFGNKMMNWIFRIAFCSNLYDILTGYRAFTRESIQELDLKKHNFVIETELTVECLMKEQRLIEVPVTYYPRAKEVASKLHPIKDGYRISTAVYKYSRFYNPIFFFGIWSVPLLLLAAVSAGYAYYSENQLFLFSAGLFFLMAVMVLLAGFVSDINTMLHRKTLKAMKAHRKQNEQEYDQF